jgi:hypothetical protein
MARILIYFGNYQKEKYFKSNEHTKLGRFDFRFIDLFF